MARSPVLLLLALGVCCSGVWGQRYEMEARFRDKSTRHPRVGQRLELECLNPREDSGTFWIHQDKGGSLHFIVFISSLSRTTFSGNQKTSPRFEASKDGKFYRLVVKSFTSQDEGNYFCLMNSNQVLYFSPGQPAFFPVTTTVATTTPAPTIQSGITEKDPCPRTPDTETTKETNFFCNILIWVPLSGACLLLLLALAVTITLCQQTRRRRCRCKRPVDRKPNAKASTPPRHV